MLQAILYLLPALVLAIPLLARRYPGEKVLLAMRTGGRVRRRRAPLARPGSRGVLLAAAHGGMLIARSLAVRPPPLPGPAS